MRPLLSIQADFSAASVEKVERLLEVLVALADDPLLRSVFALHGGTALNVFSDEVPRLSVDIDLMYVGEADVTAMQAARPAVDKRLREVLGKLGYAVRGTNDEHSGQTYRLRYGDEYLKVDVSYLARVPMLEPQTRACSICAPSVSFTVLDPRELLAGKVKALMERVASRDLFDLARIAAAAPRALDDVLTRALVLRAISTADSFPALQDPVAALSKFADPSAELIESLRFGLPADQTPDFSDLRDRVAEFLSPCSVPDGAEREYLRLLSEDSEYRPELLLSSWSDVLARAKIDPVMQWKVQNLHKRAEVV